MIDKISDLRLQRILAHGGFYHGEIDGIIGMQTKAALQQAFKGVTHVPVDRMKLAVVQMILQGFGHFYLGKIDGFYGDLTESALIEWEGYKAYGVREGKIIPTVPTPQVRTQYTKFRLFDTAEAIAEFGAPGKEIESRLVYVDSPFPLHLEWDMKTTTNRVKCHEKVADAIGAVLQDVLESYGPSGITDLGLNRYSGSYAHRRIRRGTTWSKHAFGIAFDFDAAHNGFTTPWDQSRFSGPDYDEYLAIWAKHGFANLGVQIGKDAMHFEFAKSRL